MIIAFTALTTVLNLIRIPVPYMPAFAYQLGDIVLVVAFLLFGPKTGTAVAFLNMIVAMGIFIGFGGLISSPYNFIATASMLLGVYVSSKIVSTKLFSKNDRGSKPVIVFTVITVLTRAFIMLPLDYTVYGILLSIMAGISISATQTWVLTLIPGIILYNITVPLYVVPTSYYIAKKLSKSLRIQSNLISKRPAESDADSCGMPQ